jgi:hypothetical protein
VSPPTNPREEWHIYEKLVLSKLEEHSLAHRETMLQLKRLEIELAQLKIKAGLFGIFAGTVPVLISYIYQAFFK